MFTTRPAPSEYASYYGTYVDKVPEGDILEILGRQRQETADLFARVPEEAADHRYAPGKWTVREVLGHIIDAERVFGFRALHFARGAAGEIPGMDQDEFAASARYGQRPLVSVARELFLLRGANLEQFSSWDEDVLKRTGTASGAVFSVRSLLFILAGHEQHHLRILIDRYL